MSVPFDVSIRGRASGGRWYRNPDRIVLNINILAQNTIIDDDIRIFAAALSAIYVHELVHIVGNRGGCARPDDCRAGKCWLCNYTYEIVEDILGL